jgi:hypothetical protein
MRVGSPNRPLLLATIALVLELALISPWIDHLADDNPTVHFSQHGLIFVGGLLMGWALRELRR